MSKQMAKRLEKQIKEAQKLVVKQPESAQYRKSLGALLTDKGELEKAKEQLDKAIHLKSDDHEAYSVLGKVLYNLGDYNAAVTCLKKSLEIKPGYHKSAHYLSYLLYNSNKPKEALAYIGQACLEQPKHPGYLITYGNILESLHRYEEAAEKFKQSLSIESDKYFAWNNLGNIYKQLGRMEDALYYYSQAFKVNPQSDIAYSNKITILHYIPSYSLEETAKECRDWDRYFNKVTPVRAEAQDKSADRKLRIGLISDGFRRHPVGYMITSVMEEIANYNYELFFYPTNYDADSLTERLHKVAAKWQEIKPLGVEQTENLIREDQIDILIDLAGHNSGNRMLAIAKEPAPVIMKWVGGLINTTGVKAIDYLISDHIETPSGIDEHYVENLIRLPDDYICYNSPGYAPNVASLPASVNGYITFGCFNNPTKINPDIVAVWAEILLAVPDSRMFLKGMQFSSDDLKKRVTTLFGECGVPGDRLIIEGPSAHQQLLESYHKVDIALDPWPYSGGLTTCEALLMGVPVITMPGPTFAGRHSATHLVNAGLGELVADTWEAYKQCAIGLASDLDSLSIIRKGLRQQLLDSPVCDAKRFARHLNTALRAAWQRYCEGKAPAALTFEQGGDAYFEGDANPVEILCSEPIESGQPDRFSWELPGKIVVIDNSSKLIREDRFNRLRQVNAFGFVAFDPGSRIDNPAQFEGSDDVQLFQHASLGNGEPSTLYACLDEKFSSTLDPLPIEQQHGANPQGAKVLAKLPINTISLDSINGLESLDWLILDDLSDAAAILENGVKALKETLVIQVRIAFSPTHHRQPNIAEIQHWMARHGFRFYRFNDQQHLSHLPESIPAERRQGTELQSAEAIFLPSHERMTELNDNQSAKLAFLLHTVYGIKDIAYAVLKKVSEEKADSYLRAEGFLKEFHSKELNKAGESNDVEKFKNYKGAINDKIIFVVGCGHSGTTLMASLLGAHPEVYTIEHETYWFLNRPFIEIEYPIEKRKCLEEGKSIVCEKTPRHVHKIKEMKERFPNARFVAMVRAGKDNVASLKKRMISTLGSEKSSLKYGVERWINDNETLLSLLDKDFLHVVKYEDLVTKKEFVMKEVLSFLDLEYTDDVFDFYKKGYQWFGVKDAKETTGEEGYRHLQLRAWQMTQPIKDNRGAWQKILSEKEARLVEERTKPLMNALYSPEDELEVKVPTDPHMSPAERQLFKASLKQASRYFEFGSGGSTVWAVAEGLAVKGVESDAKWISALKEKLGEKCQVDTVDIGPTKEWGFPVSLENSEKFPAYSKAIQKHKQSFDLVLVDGCFRVACTMAAIQHILEHSEDPQEARIFIHDFWNRPHYHAVLPFLDTLEKVESAGLFRVSESVKKEDVVDVLEQYSRQPH